MPDEEKKRRREESSRLKEEGNEQFKKGDYIEAESSYTEPFRCVHPASRKTGLFCFQIELLRG